MSVWKRPRNRLDVFSGLAVSSLKPCSLKGEFMGAPKVQKCSLRRLGDRVLRLRSIFPRSAHYSGCSWEQFTFAASRAGANRVSECRIVRPGGWPELASSWQTDWQLQLKRRSRWSSGPWPKMTEGWPAESWQPQECWREWSAWGPQLV